MQKYNPSEIEAKWQEVWEKERIYSPNLDSAKKPFYNLMMFPYPSAEGMHVGNMYAFTGADVYGRFQRMQGKAVFEPIGLDGFGIHSENYAIKVGKHPVEQAKISEKNFYRQLKSIGNSFDWTRTVETYKPEYYKWTQWLFIQLFKTGLAYRKKAPVNFCPSCKTVLADEQVIEKSKIKNQKSKIEEIINVCERCESEVVKKDLEQWFFKITKYADRLLNGLSQIDWAEKVKIAQKQWIGKSEGVIINFEINNKTNYILLHGFTGSPDRNFFPWLMQELEKRNHKVYAPQLPNTNDPDINAQAEFALRNANFDENTVLFGHSLGCAVALKIAERLKKPIRKLVLAAGFAQPKFLDKLRPFEKKFDWNFDFEKIKKNVGKIIILRAKNDTAVPQERSDYIKSKIGGIIVDFIAENDHICGTKEPVVLENLIESIDVFTTRPETIDGATFLVLSPQHPKAKEFKSKEVKDYIEISSKKTDEERRKEKTGVFSGEYVVNPLTKKEVPIWIADYVLMGYGTGAIMAVPAEDERDREFAEKYKIPITKTSLSAKPEGEKTVNYHLRDWLISRQRYWGPPIPMVFCQNCSDKGVSWFSEAEENEHGVSSSKYQVSSKDEKILNTKYLIHNTDMAGWQPVPKKDLPVELPYIKDYKPLGTGVAPLASHPEFYKTKCPKCGGEAKRETDVSDTFLDSSWYFLRYLATDWNDIPFPMPKSKIKNQKSKIIGNLELEIGNSAQRAAWLPVNMYIGGAEHSVLHLLYSRFVTMALKDLGFINFEEPFTKFRAHGLIVKDGAKMSKSKGNVVVPDAYIKKFGADALRCYLLFTGPFTMGGDFRDSGIEGMSKFLNRVWNLVSSKKTLTDGEVDIYLQKLTEEITEEINNLRYNTAISRLMMYYNFLTKKNVDGHKIYKSEIINFVKMIAPFAPHLADEMWEVLGQKSSVHIQIWPAIDKEELKNFFGFTMAIQINGKTRATMDLEVNLSKEEAEKRAGSLVEKYLTGKKIVKVIYVEGKVINFVIG